MGALRWEVAVERDDVAVRAGRVGWFARVGQVDAPAGLAPRGPPGRRSPGGQRVGSLVRAVPLDD